MDIISLKKAKVAEQKADNVQEQLNQAVQDGDQLAETQQARVDAEGNPHATLKARLDAEKEETDQKVQSLTTQLAHTGSQLNDRIDGLVINQGQDSSAEVGDARQDFLGGQHDLLRQRLETDIGYVQGFKTFTTVPIYENGVVVRIEERDGSEVISSTTLNRDAKGRVTSTTKTIAGKEVVSTYNKDADGKLESITREVI